MHGREPYIQKKSSLDFRVYLINIFKVLILTWNAQQQKNEYTESDIRACLWLSDRDIALASTRFQVEKLANQHDPPIFWLTNHQPRKLKIKISAKKLKKMAINVRIMSYLKF